MWTGCILLTVFLHSIIILDLPVQAAYFHKNVPLATEELYEENKNGNLDAAGMQQNEPRADEVVPFGSYDAGYNSGERAASVDHWNVVNNDLHFEEKQDGTLSLPYKAYEPSESINKLHTGKKTVKAVRTTVANPEHIAKFIKSMRATVNGLDKNISRLEKIYLVSSGHNTASIRKLTDGQNFLNGLILKSKNNWVARRGIHFSGVHSKPTKKRKANAYNVETISNGQNLNQYPNAAPSEYNTKKYLRHTNQFTSGGENEIKNWKSQIQQCKRVLDEAVAEAAQNADLNKVCGEHSLSMHLNPNLLPDEILNRPMGHVPGLEQATPQEELNFLETFTSKNYDRLKQQNSNVKVQNSRKRAIGLDGTIGWNTHILHGLKRESNAATNKRIRKRSVKSTYAKYGDLYV